MSFEIGQKVALNVPIGIFGEGTVCTVTDPDVRQQELWPWTVAVHIDDGTTDGFDICVAPDEIEVLND